MHGGTMGERKKCLCRTDPSIEDTVTRGIVILRKSLSMLFLHQTQLNDVYKHPRPRIGTREGRAPRCEHICSHQICMPRWSHVQTYQGQVPPYRQGPGASAVFNGPWGRPGRPRAARRRSWAAGTSPCHRVATPGTGPDGGASVAAARPPCALRAVASASHAHLPN